MKVNHEIVGGLKGVIRLLQQAEAIYAISWRWSTDTSRPAEGEPQKKSTSIVRMLPVLKRMTAKPRVLFAALSRSLRALRNWLFDACKISFFVHRVTRIIWWCARERTSTTKL